MGIFTFGTQVYLKQDGRVVIVPPEDKYNPEETDRRMAEVVNIQISMKVGEAVRAYIECYPSADNVLIALEREIGFLEHFRSARARRIARVLFDDGSEWIPPENRPSTILDRMRKNG